MKRMQLVSPGTLSRMRQEVQSAWERRDLHRCIEILERMNRMRPADPDVLIQLGYMHGLLHYFEKAGMYFELAVKMAPPDRKAEMLAEAGQQARDFSDGAMAEGYVNRALEEKSATSKMFVQLAEICERGRRLAEANVLVERALHRDAGCPFALLARAHLQYRAGQFEEAERNLRPLVEPNATNEVRVRAWYELGALLDRQGRYDEAMQAFLQAKALLRSVGAPFLALRKGMMARVNQMRQSIRPDLLRRWFEFGRELQPAHRLCLLGGHPRSGTTLLEQVLDAHPDIVSAEETHLFQDNAGAALNRRWPAGTPILKLLDAAPKDLLLACREAYSRASERCLGAPLGNRLLIDKNPSLTLSIPGLARVFPEMRFLVALRDPRDVVLSCFMQPSLPIRQINSTWLNLETAAEEYAGVMGTWRTLAPMLPLPHLEIRYEDIVTDLESVARHVLEFLQVQWDEQVLNFDEHARRKRVRSPSYADVTQKVFTRAVGRWRHYQKYLEPHLAILEPFAKAFGYE